MIVFCLGGISQLRAQVTIYNPTPSTVVDLGQTLSITWNTNVTGGTVNIELYKGGVDYATIATSIANNHSYDWVVPSTLHGGNDYQVYISSSTSGNALSPTFTIAYSLNVTSGNNTMVSAGEQMGFSWSTSLNQGYLNLDYKNASGGWTSIASNVSYTATPYTWTTPSGSNYVSPTEVRITSTADPSLVAYVQNITLTKTLNLTSPSSTTNLIVGDMLPVRWSSNYAGASG